LTMRVVWMVGLLVGTGCIPVKKNYVTWPGRVVRVVDAKSNAPIPDAKIRMAREEFPHRREVEVRALTTDAKGEIRTEKVSTTITVYPLMMHGVPGFAFIACAEAPGYASSRAEFSDGDDESTLVLKLARGSRPCVVKMDKTALPDGAARIEGVEEDGSSWIVQLAVSSEHPARAGDRLSKDGATLEVVELLWQSNAPGPLRHARVRVRGEAKGYVFGDIVSRTRVL
jgi:hypothetical protein